MEFVYALLGGNHSSSGHPHLKTPLRKTMAKMGVDTKSRSRYNKSMLPLVKKKKIWYISSPMKKILLGLFLIVLLMFTLSYERVQMHMFAAEKNASSSGVLKKVVKKTDDITRDEVLSLFSARKITNITPLNFVGYEVQRSIRAGVPVNTIMLILLMPVLATIVAFFRHVVGIPSLGIIVPVALSITLLSTGVTTGIVLLAVIIVASVFARVLFKRIRIMQLAKVSLSLFVVSVFIFIALTVGTSAKLLSDTQSAIFPVLMLILLSERLLGVQLERNPQEATQIIILTLALSILGYLLLSSRMVRDVVLLYPETVLLVLPINILIGRYFGLRITEYFRFGRVIHNGSKS